MRAMSTNIYRYELCKNSGVCGEITSLSLLRRINCGDYKMIRRIDVLKEKLASS